MNRYNTFSFPSSDHLDSTGPPAFVLCWLHLLFIFTSVCILIWIMEEVSEEEEGCERGVPHSMCPWLFSAPALEQVERGWGVVGCRKRRTVGLGVWLCLVQGQVSGSCSLFPLHLLLPACLLTWLALLSDLITVYKSKASCQPHSLH